MRSLSSAQYCGSASLSDTNGVPYCRYWRRLAQPASCYIPADSICTTRLRNAVSLLTWSYARLRRIINRYMPFSRTGCGVGITVQILELRSGFQTTFCLLCPLPQGKMQIWAFSRYGFTKGPLPQICSKSHRWNDPFARQPWGILRRAAFQL